MRLDKPHSGGIEYNQGKSTTKPSGQGAGHEAQFPIGGTAREREMRRTRCDSGADGTVRMKEGSL